jgi:biotin carboxyl carrier protein
MLYDVTIDGKNYRLDLNRAEGRWSCRLDGRELEVDAILARPDVLSLRIGNMAFEVKSERVANDLHLWVGSTRFAAEVRDPRSLRGRTRAGDEQGPKKIVAPMPGKVVRLLVRNGDRGGIRRRCRCGGGDEDAERNQIAEERHRAEDSGD